MTLFRRTLQTDALGKSAPTEAEALTRKGAPALGTLFVTIRSMFRGEEGRTCQGVARNTHLQAGVSR